MYIKFKLRSIIIIIIFCICFRLYGQNSYFSTDTSSSYGVKIIGSSAIDNANFIKIKINDHKTVIYTPDQISEYGFNNGTAYVSKEIPNDSGSVKVFLERLTEGKITLFYYRDKGIRTFYIEKDSATLLEIPKGEKNDHIFHKKLMDNTSDCVHSAEATKIVSYTKPSMTKLIRNYNECILRPFPHLKYGLSFGNELAKLKAPFESSDITFIDFTYDAAFMTGIFVDLPIEASDISLHTELYFSKHGYSYNVNEDGKELDFVANISSFKLPVLIRYTLPTYKFRPFVNLGATMTFNLKNENFFYEATRINNIIEINGAPKSSFIPKKQLGYSFGAGCEYKLSYTNSLFFELRYNQLLSGEDALNQSIINLITGINF